MAKIQAKPPCSVCGEESKAHGLCETHYMRWRRNGHTEVTRPKDWGSKTSHPLYGTWCQTLKVKEGRHQRWNNFWNFVSDVGEKPSENHRLYRKDVTKPYAPDNCYWKLSVGSSEDKAKYQRTWRELNPEKSKAIYIKKTYGISLEQYDNMLVAQDGKCAICGKEETTTINGRLIMLAVDHCHNSNAVRGLLCRLCNQAIGLLKDDVDLLHKAIDYLNGHGSTKQEDEPLEIPEAEIVYHPSVDEIEEHEAHIFVAPIKPLKPRSRCAVDWCDGVVRGHGLCARHYKQLNAGHDPHKIVRCQQCDKHISEGKYITAKFCSVSCRMKYYRAKGCYSPEQQADNPRCSIDGCERVHHSQGLCKKHYMRKWHEENPSEVAYKKGDSLPQEIRDKMSKPIREVTTGIEFTALINALEYYDMKMPTLTRALQSGKPITKGDKRGLQFIYADSVNKDTANPNLRGERYAAPVIDYTHCSIEGCDKPHAARGFCMYHYKQHRKTA